MEKISEKMIMVVGLLLVAMVILWVVLLQGKTQPNDEISSSSVSEQVLTTESQMEGTKKSDLEIEDTENFSETSSEEAAALETLESTREEVTEEQTEEKTAPTIEEPTEQTTEELSAEAGKVEIVEKEEATYEEWLAASMVIGISMKYMDFEIMDMYLASETALGKKQHSAGVYIVFASEGEMMVIHSLPLSEERSEAGTTDIYTKDLGFATFDPIFCESLGNIDTSIWKKVEMEDLGQLISQSILVSLYEH